MNKKRTNIHFIDYRLNVVRVIECYDLFSDGIAYWPATGAPALVHGNLQQTHDRNERNRNYSQTTTR